MYKSAWRLWNNICRVHQYYVLLSATFGELEMSVGVIGIKSGMTRVFTETGESVPVTVIHVAPNRISQVKTPDQDGYAAIQVTAGERRASRVSKPQAGHFKKAGVGVGRLTREFRLTPEELESFKAGDEVALDHFKEGQMVDVRATSKGKGFQGGVKRHNFRTQDATHGNSLSHRAIGSAGQCQTPGRVFKGKKMPGQMGNVKTVIQNQKIVRVDAENHLLLIKGTVPGAPGAYVMVLPSVKQKEAK